VGFRKLGCSWTELWQVSANAVYQPQALVAGPTKLVYAVRLEEEREILPGSGGANGQLDTRVRVSS
jgi:hypothetical protein